ncbi:IS66 family transposase [Paludisphaera mucosa]|uniref:IS66 family transposase n=1 Tax=Paludisphaera mucosa TaxID=3030827 RepID=A0ABT6FE60_9BACT|nr:IS66 family transposase [Paludisphaera mucosa]
MIPPEQRACPGCGHYRSPIGEEVSEHPASLFVVEHVTIEVACRHCQGHVPVADKPPQPIEKGLPGPGLLAQVITSKVADHLPLYRQKGIFARHGVELSRKTLCGWMAQSAWLLEPIWKAVKDEVLKSRVIQTDDATVPVLDRRLDRARTARLWVYLGDRERPYVVYDYTADRSRDGPEQFLGDYEGYLQADAYSGYDRIYSRGVVEVGCFAQARRKFYDARTSDPERSHEASARIRAFYAVEATGTGLDDEARLALRRDRSVPLLTRLGTWLDEQARVVLPKSPIGAAIGYARSNWAALNRLAEAGYLSIDDNAGERAVKPIALGRKNWLSAGSESGGWTAAILLCLASTCRALKMDPSPTSATFWIGSTPTRPGGSRNCCPIAGGLSDASRDQPWRGDHGRHRWLVWRPARPDDTGPPSPATTSSTRTTAASPVARSTGRGEGAIRPGRGRFCCAFGAAPALPRRQVAGADHVNQTMTPSGVEQTSRRRPRRTARYCEPDDDAFRRRAEFGA